MNNSLLQDQKDPFRVAYLIAGFVREILTEEEHDELDEWIIQHDGNMKIFEDLTDPENIAASLAFMDRVQEEADFQQLVKRLPEAQRITKSGRIRRISMAAAACLVLTLVASWLLHTSKKESSMQQAETGPDTTWLQPGSNKAILKTEKGQIIDLQQAPEGRIAVGVMKQEDGKLIYTEAERELPVQAHTLSTPAGGQYQVELQDGTEVWLNAETVLTYPSRFTGGERVVELSGEAYFEVAKNAEQPFRVKLKDSTDIKVLGTHFNIKSYNDERVSQITLLEGSVAVNMNERTKKLQPGMQAQVVKGSMEIRNHADTEEITGWKDGLFVFRDDPIEKIMEQVKRWYGARIIIQGKINQQFNAVIRRNEPLTKLLQLLETNGYVRFKTENQTIYVLPR